MKKKQAKELRQWLKKELKHSVRNLNAAVETRDDKVIFNAACWVVATAEVVKKEARCD